jgi:hypothetical protein
MYVMKGKQREGPKNYVHYYWITPPTAYLNLSRNCISLLTAVLAKTETVLLSISLQH